MPLPDPRAADPQKPNNAGPLAMLAGVFVGLFGIGTVVGWLLGEPLSQTRKALGALAIVGGGAALRWGRAQRRAWSERREALVASIPAADRMLDAEDALAKLAATFGGEVVRASPLPLKEAILADDAELNRPERYDRVVFVRSAVPQLAYSSHMDGRRTHDDAGPGINREGYWRVRAEVNTNHEFHIVGKDIGDALLAGLGAPSQTLGDEAFDRAFTVRRSSSMEWLQKNLTEEARVLLLQHPTFIARCHRGRVEVLWPSAFGPQTLSRFEAASLLVTSLARALSGLPPGPFR